VAGPDQSLPALKGKTPRQAAGLKTLRPTLIALLKDMENREAHAALEGRPPYDFSWLWQELELQRNLSLSLLSLFSSPEARIHG
jgi:hypothetical protein